MVMIHESLRVCTCYFLQPLAVQLGPELQYIFDLRVKKNHTNTPLCGGNDGGLP